VVAAARKIKSQTAESPQVTKLIDQRWQSNAVCPCCGQKVYLRRGAILSPRRADVFDMIDQQSKRGGIRSDVLIGLFGKAVIVHVSDINKLLRPKGWEIFCAREGSARGFYKIRRIKNAVQPRNQARGASLRNQDAEAGLSKLGNSKPDEAIGGHHEDRNHGRNSARL
jgi:hypothetical protein